MELTLKQKIIAFGIMLLIFLMSVFIKQMMNSDFDFFDNDSHVIDETLLEGEADAGSEDGTLKKENTEESSGSLGGTISDEDLIVIDVEGAIMYPGIVKIPWGSRIYQAIDAAGGLIDTADTRYVNLAEEVQDGSIVYIPFKGENAGTEGADVSGGSDGAVVASQSGLININTADRNTLMQLPGIGEAYADAIISYRSNTGAFKKPEDIMNVSGIGEAKFSKLSGLICVY